MRRMDVGAGLLTRPRADLNGAPSVGPYIIANDVGVKRSPLPFRERVRVRVGVGSGENAAARGGLVLRGRPKFKNGPDG